MSRMAPLCLLAARPRLVRASLAHGLSRAFLAPALTTPVGARADSNVEVIRSEFKKQASLYSPHPKAIDFVMSEVGKVSGTAIDVASGTGVFAMALAPFCEQVVSFDATKEMQERAKKTAAEEGLSNLTFQLGDGTEMPFSDGSFDLVVSRLAIHHFADPGSIVKEMVRVCKPGGRVVLADIIADDDPEQHAETDRLEILRDPSHTACPTLKGLHGLLEATGRMQVQPHSGNIYMHPLQADFWMNNTETPQPAREEIVRCFQAELKGGKKTGMQPFLDKEGVMSFLHRYAVAQGVRV